MEILIVLGVAVYLGLMTWIGYKRGFIKTVLSLAALLGAIILTCMFTVPIAAMVKNVTPIYSSIEKEVAEYIGDTGEAINIDNLSIPNSLKTIIKDKTVMLSSPEATADRISKIVANAIFHAGVFIVTFIVCYIGLIILINTIDLISRLPFLNGINRLTGAAVGLAYGVVMLWVVSLILPMFSNTDWARAAIDAINNNALLTFMYNNNLLVVLINNISK